MAEAADTLQEIAVVSGPGQWPQCLSNACLSFSAYRLMHPNCQTNRFQKRTSCKAISHCQLCRFLLAIFISYSFK